MAKRTDAPVCGAQTAWEGYPCKGRVCLTPYVRKVKPGEPGIEFVPVSIEQEGELKVCDRCFRAAVVTTVEAAA